MTQGPDIKRNDFIHSTFMENSLESIPIGNGDIGANVWIQNDGAVRILISKTDAWSEIFRILKLGLLKLSVSPCPFSEKNLPITQLSLADGLLYITDAANTVKITLYIDANAPALRLIVFSKTPMKVILAHMNYRDCRKEYSTDDRSNFTMLFYPGRTFENADMIMDGDALSWCHHNESSIAPILITQQKLTACEAANDPLLDRTFGVYANGEGFSRTAPGVLLSGTACQHTLTACALTKNCSVEQWYDEIKSMYEQYAHVKDTLELHKSWWETFWARSYILIDGDDIAERISRAYTLQRYMNACGCRGNAPAKFNGSIFTVHPAPYDKNNYDYRDWGAAYWQQNTRLIYWNLLFSGEFEMMQPLFTFLKGVMPVCEYRCNVQYGHPGLHLTEVITPFGTRSGSDYEWETGKHIRQLGLKDGRITNSCLRWHYNGQLEYSYLMLKYYAFTGDKVLLKSFFIPFIKKSLEFFYYEFKTPEGKLHLNPVSSLETWHDCENDTPDVAGLTRICEYAQKLLSDVTEANDLCAFCKIMQPMLPELPIGERNRQRVIAPCSISHVREMNNVENPELYAVFPYDMFDLTSDDANLARDTYHNRINHTSRGWQQDLIQAAMLGMDRECKRLVSQCTEQVCTGCLFPVYWGPNYDWTPDQDHGTVFSTGLIHMLLTQTDDKLCLLPAWPKEWNVQFKLPCVGGGSIECEFKDGNMSKLVLNSVDPAKLIC